MEDQSISLNIGNNVITFQAEQNPHDEGFLKDLQTVAATKPTSMHELFNRLAALQKSEKEANPEMLPALASRRPRSGRKQKASDNRKKGPSH